MVAIIYFVIFAIFVSFFRKNKSDTFLDKTSSQSIKGLFILMIVLSHILNTFPYDGFLFVPISYFRAILGQLVVSFFFFTSGFGITKSINQKGQAYSKTILVNRFLRIIIYSFILLIPYYIYCFCVGETHSNSDYFLSLFGLFSFGNESWFLFVILFCYLCCGIVFMFNFKNKYVPYIIISMLVVLFIIIAFLLKVDSNYYDTIICFVLGIWTSLFFERINAFLRKTFRSIILMVLSVLIVPLMYFLSHNYFPISLPYLLCFSLSNISFCVFFVCLTKIVSIKSPVLVLLGNASFGIFMMHKLTIIIFSKTQFIANQYVFYAVLFLLSVLVGIPFLFVFKILDRKVMKPIVDFSKQYILFD